MNWWPIKTIDFVWLRIRLMRRVLCHWVLRLIHFNTMALYSRARNSDKMCSMVAHLPNQRWEEKIFFDLFNNPKLPFLRRLLGLSALHLNSIERSPCSVCAVHLTLCDACSRIKSNVPRECIYVEFPRCVSNYDYYLFICTRSTSQFAPTKKKRIVPKRKQPE